MIRCGGDALPRVGRLPATEKQVGGPAGTLRALSNYLNSVAYFRAISLICSRVSCFGGTPGGVQVSRKKLSQPAGDTIQSRSSS